MSAGTLGYGLVAHSCAQEGTHGSIATAELSNLQRQSSDGSSNMSCATVFCQVLGCQVRLTKSYCIKKRACTTHLQADAVQLSADDTNLWRFCQQCGKFEVLSKFDDGKRSCRARLAKRRSGTRAQLLKKTSGMRATSDKSTPEHIAALEQVEAAPAAGEATDDQAPAVCTNWISPGPGMQLPANELLQTVDSNLGTSATDGDVCDCAAPHLSHQLPLPQMLSMPKEEHMEAWLLEAATSATAVTAILSAGGHAVSTAPLMDTPVQLVQGNTPAAAAANSVFMSLGMHKQAASALSMDLEDSDIGEEGNLDAILLQEVVEEVLQKDLGHNWQQHQHQQQPPVMMPEQQMQQPLLAAEGGSSSSGGGIMPSGHVCSCVACAGVVAPAITSGTAGEPDMTHCWAVPLSHHKQYPAPAANATTSASTVASGMASAAHVEGWAPMSADLQRLQSDASAAHMGSSGGAAAHARLQPPPQGVAALLPGLDSMQQQMGPGNPNDRASSRSNGRLQWLMQQLAQELQQCDEDDLYDLEDEELNMLLQTAYTPGSASCQPGLSAVAGDGAVATAGSMAMAATQAGGCQGVSLQQYAGHLPQHQQQGWAASFTKSAAMWPCQTSSGAMLQAQNPPATDMLVPSTAMTAPLPAVPPVHLCSALPPTGATAADTWPTVQQQPHQLLLAPSLELSGSVQANVSGLPGLFQDCSGLLGLLYDCSGPVSPGEVVDVPGLPSSWCAVAGQAGSPWASANQLGDPHLDCQCTQCISHGKQQLLRQQEPVQVPGWW